MKNRFVFYTLIIYFLSSQAIFSCFCSSSRTIKNVINPSDHQDAIIQKYKELEQDQRTEEGQTIYDLSRKIHETQSPEEKALFASQATAILQRQLNEDHFLSDQKRKSKESLVRLFSHHIKKQS